LLKIFYTYTHEGYWCLSSFLSLLSLVSVPELFYFEKISWALVAHTYSPSYSGGRDQEDFSLKPAWASSSQDPTLKKPSQK
jgi:hypothetical protein